jgi:hypothetical protein
MEPIIGLTLIGLVVGLVARWASTFAGLGDRTLSGLFRAPDPGWPVGVHENDDQHWNWSPSPDAEMPDDRADPVAVQRVHGDMRASAR